MPTMTGRIDDVSVVKEGVSGTGRPWVLYRVEAMGKKLTTFDGKWAGLVGQTVEIDYTTEQNGKYTNYKIVDTKGPRVKPNGVGSTTASEARAAMPDTDRILAAIADLKSTMLKALGIGENEKVPF